MRGTSVSAKKIKKIKKFSPTKYLIAIAVFAIALVLALVGIIHLSGVRYVKYEIEDMTVKFLGKVNSNGEYISGDVYYSDGTKAKYSYDATTQKAKLSYSTGDVYEGDIEMFLRHGTGTVIYSDTSIYTGQFLYDTICGNGTFYYVGGDIYEGELVDGLKHGSGVYTWPLNADRKGDKYEGEYHKDLRNGKGTYTWADGTVYTGDYVNDIKSGKGKMIFTNGDVYEGDFANDVRTGEGTYTFANGDVYVGQFQNNQITGYGVYTWASENSTIKTYEGYFENGVPVTVPEDK